MLDNNNKTKKQLLTGFTIIEMLIAVSLFTLMVVMASGIFVSGLKAQRENLAYQELLGQTSYVMEYMSRSIRMARKDINGDCITAKLNYETTRGGRGFEFLNYNGVCQEFFWDDTAYRLKEVRGEEENFLTPGDLEIAVFSIELAGQSQNDDNQPRVTIFLESRQPKIKIQTTISQRNLDVNR